MRLVPTLATAPAQTRSSQGRLVVVEGHEGCRLLLLEVLSDAGYVVWATDRGVEALELVERVGPDAVVFDLHPPDLASHALLGALRERSVASGLALVGMTARDEPEPVGLMGFLKKPFSLDVLLRTVAVASGANGSAALPQLARS